MQVSNPVPKYSKNGYALEEPQHLTHEHRLSCLSDSFCSHLGPEPELEKVQPGCLSSACLATSGE